jgi:ribosomal protein S27AE
MRRSLSALPAFAIALLAAAAWYWAGERVALRLGAAEFAPAARLLVGAVIGLTLWRRNATDELETSLRRLVCPACGARLAAEHEHAGDAQPDGLTAWSCAACGYAHAAALTCKECDR